MDPVTRYSGKEPTRPCHECGKVILVTDGNYFGEEKTTEHFVCKDCYVGIMDEDYHPADEYT